MADPLVLALIFSTSLLVAYSGAASPGPVTMMTIAASAQIGWRAGPLIATGHSLLELGLVAGLAIGLGAALQHPWIAAVVSVGGGLMLLWMAWGTLHSVPRLRRIALTADVPAARSALQLLAAGVALSIANPYWLLWWLTIGATYVVTALGQAGLVGLAAFYVGHILADYSWGTLVGVLVHGGRRWLGGPLYQGLIGLCGVVLAALGVLFLTSGLRALLG
ncbi:MAG: LysE family transporter [Chloroflexi bacterium]|nr:LysE family transporter [Chloroflexota bacterium]